VQDLVDLTPALLAVKLVLPLATLALLLQPRWESAGREHLLEQMAHAARIVSRQEYFNAVHVAMLSAKNLDQRIYHGINSFNNRAKGSGSDHRRPNFARENPRRQDPIHITEVTRPARSCRSISRGWRGNSALFRHNRQRSTVYRNRYRVHSARTTKQRENQPTRGGM